MPLKSLACPWAHCLLPTHGPHTGCTHRSPLELPGPCAQALEQYNKQEAMASVMCLGQGE